MCLFAYQMDTLAAPQKSSILDMLPGDSIAAKAGYLTAGTALGTALIAKEIYILNEESLVLLTTAGFLGVLLKYTREPFTNMANEHIQVRISYKKNDEMLHLEGV